MVDRVYNGGSTGANYNLALHHAKTARKKYFAIARGGGDGHAFAFSSLDLGKGGFINGGDVNVHALTWRTRYVVAWMMAAVDQFQRARNTTAAGLYMRWLVRNRQTRDFL